MKKALVAALVLTFVLSIAATASAAVLTPASFPDVEGKACADALAKLQPLGIAKGYEDGTWRPDEPVTRAMFAAFAVRILGLENVAKYMTGPTKFPDVPADHWANGYINVAVAKKLVLGYPDGTFRPNDPINFAQAATMLGRAIGYVNMPGEWPANYLVATTERGIFEGVEFSAGDVVTRGDMAIMLWNTLTAQMVNYRYVEELGIWDYTDRWQDPPSNTKPENLLHLAFGSVFEEDKIVEKTADIVGSGLKADQVKIAGVTDPYTVPTTVDWAALLGHELSLLRKGSKVLFAEDTTGTDAILTGKVVSRDATQIEVKVGTTNVTKYWAPSVIAYANKSPVSGTTGAQVYSSFAVDDQVTLILDSDGKVRFIAGFNLNYPNQLVKSVSTTAKTIKTNQLTTATAVASNATIFKNGKPATLADIKAGDVADVLVQGSEVVYIAASDAKVTGTVASVKVKLDGSKYLVIGTNEYKVIASPIFQRDGRDVTGMELGDTVGAVVTLSLNPAGQAAVINVSESAGVVGYFDANDPGAAGTIKLVNAGGEVTLTLGSGVTRPSASGYYLAMVSNGSVTQIVSVTLGSTTYEVIAVDEERGKLTLKDPSNVIVVADVASNAQFRDSSAAAGEGWHSLSDLAASVGRTPAPTIRFSNEATKLVLYAETANVSPAPDEVYGKYVGEVTSSYTGVTTLYLEVRGGMKTYASAMSTPAFGSGVSVGEFVYASLSSGKWTACDELTADTGYTVVAISGKLVTLEKSGSYTTVTIETDVPVYEGEDAVYKGLGVSQVTVGDTIDLYKKGNVLKLVHVNP